MQTELMFMIQKRIAFAILAHVDAGKTTLGEWLLYRTRAVRTLGAERC